MDRLREAQIHDIIKGIGSIRNDEPSSSKKKENSNEKITVTSRTGTRSKVASKSSSNGSRLERTDGASKVVFEFFHDKLNFSMKYFNVLGFFQR